jgi:arabinan endo-1,5-alpha-L-arabinosidase
LFAIKGSKSDTMGCRDESSTAHLFHLLRSFFLNRGISVSHFIIFRWENSPYLTLQKKGIKRHHSFTQSMKGIKNSKIPVLCILLSITAWDLTAQSWPAGIHDPSHIVECDSTYWIFGTGEGIYSIYSKDLISWQSGPTPFTKTGYPDWIKTYVSAFEGTFWAPDIIYMNHQYYLYYSCSEWGTMTSTIGCVTNKTLNPYDPDYEWVDMGFLGIWSYQPGLALNAIDPSLMRGPDGKIWMVYGSFNEQGLVVTEIDSITGKPKTYAGNLPGTSIANSWTGSRYGEGEGASMFYRDGYYYLFYNKGGCCAGIASTYYIVMGRSTNPRGPFYDKEGKPMRCIHQQSGGTVVLKHDDSRGTDDRYFGPGHFGLFSENGVDYVTFHYYDPNGYYPNPAVNNQGGPTLGLAKLVWEEDGWPSISLNFVDEGVYPIENLQSKKVVDVLSHTLSEGTSLYQYAADTAFFTQKWILKSLGTGEYTITNYADPDMYVEAGGTNHATTLSVTSNYEGTVHQKFRMVTSPQGETLLYPSTKDVVWRLLAPTDNDIRISLGSNSNQDYQRWNVIPFDESFGISETKLTVDHSAGTDRSIVVESNGLWSASVLYDSWIKVETSGIKNDRLTITYEENPDAGDRRNRIYVTSNGGESFILTVTQQGNPNSMADVQDKDFVVMYFNPAQHVVHLDMKNKGKLTVYNQSGQKIREYDLQAGMNNLDIGSFKRGLYFFHILSNHQTLVKKLIKN